MSLEGNRWLKVDNQNSSSCPNKGLELQGIKYRETESTASTRTTRSYYGHLFMAHKNDHVSFLY